ncbi:HEAT repeat domain-containing protein [Poriferisphaera sp. WC338]|uniref:HEAT repeat domain-containing protein n=1 Tax=Poriferisphaera sp. WC338 TaxID=3425129 RepID=UPI003D81AB5D
MSKRRLEDQLDELSQLREAGDDDALQTGVLKAIKGKNSIVAAKAAVIAGEMMMNGVADELVKMFERFCVNGVKNDPGCRAKVAAVGALYQLDMAEPEVYVKAARMRQMEPVWGGREDTATELRNVAALAMVRCHYGDVMNELAMLLADDEHVVRAGAAKAIGYRGLGDGEPLLRLAVLGAEEDVDVLSECMLSILQIGIEAGIDFVTGFIGDESRETHERAAIIALGQSRLESAFNVLREAYERTLDEETRGDLLTAMSMLRLDHVTDYLIGLVRYGDDITGEAVVRAMAIYHYDEKLKDRLLDAAREASVRQVIEMVFD